MAAASKKPNRAPAECPVCGADVPPNARACPECGADERTGWNDEDTRCDGLDLPDSAYDDDSPATKPAASIRERSNRIALHWWLTAFALITVFVTAALYRLF
jgi:predicted nucleic acid-binding Zn ribbon protein